MGNVRGQIIAAMARIEINRHRDESIMIGDDIEIVVVDVRGDKVRLGIISPREVPPHRKEVWEALRLAKATPPAHPEPAAQSAPAQPTGPLPHIRPASEADLPAIDEIYNWYIPRSTCTYQEEIEPFESRVEWFRHHGERQPVTIAERDGHVVGWGSLSGFRDRSAYRFTCEDSVYVQHDLQGQGIGSALLADLIERARALGYHSMIAGIDGEQTASVALHRKFGFVQVAHMKRVGFKFDRWLDVIFMQLMLPSPVTRGE